MSCFIIQMTVCTYAKYLDSSSRSKDLSTVMMKSRMTFFDAHWCQIKDSSDAFINTVLLMHIYPRRPLDEARSIFKKNRTGEILGSPFFSQITFRKVKRLRALEGLQAGTSVDLRRWKETSFPYHTLSKGTCTNGRRETNGWCSPKTDRLIIYEFALWIVLFSSKLRTCSNPLEDKARDS